MKAVVIGATGLIGKKIIEELVLHPQISKIFVLTRRSNTIVSNKIEEVLFSDLSELSQLDKTIKADYFFCCLGTTLKKAGTRERFCQVDEIAVLDFAGMAKASQESTFILVSSQGANERSRLFYPQVKGRVERRIKELQLFRTIIFRPSLLIGEREESRIIEGIAQGAYRALSTFLSKNLMSSMGTDAEKLSKMMIKKALEGGPKFEIIESRDIGSSL